MPIYYNEGMTRNENPARNQAMLTAIIAVGSRTYTKQVPSLAYLQAYAKILVATSGKRVIVKISE